jgi:universal stress protein E
VILRGRLTVEKRGSIMKQLSRILAVLDGSDGDAVIMAKAVELAHQHHASLELFLCDAQRAYSFQHAYDQSGIEASRRACVRDLRRYLKCLRDTVVGADVPICVDAVCESPLYEGIVRKVLKSRCDLVIKNAASAHPLRPFAWDANDWQLMRSCPATLLLSRGKSWQPRPRFAAAVDPSGSGTLELPEVIVRASMLLSEGFHGDLDVLYSEPHEMGPREHELHVKALEVLTRAASSNAVTVHILSGEARETLPAFAAAHRYDAFIMGALSHERGFSTLVGTLTAKLVETLDCDFLLVKPDSFRSQVEMSAPSEAEEELEGARLEPRTAVTPDFVSAWQMRAS